MTTHALRLPRAFALGAAVAVGAVGLTGVAELPVANASCASFFGIGNSANCTSTLTSVAIAVGVDAQAHANGVLGAAISWGEGTSAETAGMWNFALTRGVNSSTYAGGMLSAGIAWAVNNATASAGTGSMSDNNWWNLAVVGGARTDEASTVTVNGVGNLGVGFLSSGTVNADGVGTVTVNSLGPQNNLTNNGTFSNVSSLLSGDSTMTNSGGFGSWAWDIVGAVNTLQTSGKFSVAGAFSQEDVTVVQDGPGFNVKFRSSGDLPSRTKAQPAGIGGGQRGPSATSVEGGKRAAGHGARVRNHD
jgi:hypothetical protein